jgi:D-alanine-D-alanine ligase
MRIAFTHNLQLSHAEEEAEFDTPETVAMLTQGLRALGHEVEPIEVSGPAARVVARLEALGPDLVFNTAEGSRGRFREAFYPALFDRLAIPFTGSDAYVCALTLDKALTKLMLEGHGVRSPRGMVVDDLSKLDVKGWRFPLIAKPNYEGSSMGITTDSVVDDEESLRSLLFSLLGRYPAGILVEEFIVGRDLVVPFIEGSSPKTGGVLEPASYHFDESYTGNRKYQLYDFELKTVGFDAVHVKVPAEITEAQRAKVMDLSRTVFRVLGVRDAGRIDFRIGDDGELFFIELNALPSFEKGASLYVSGALAGLESTEAVLDAVVKSAADRYGISVSRARRGGRRSRPRVGITFNLRAPGTERTEGEEDDRDAEFDTPETIAKIREAIESYGHEVVELEATPELPAILPSQGVDIVFNIAEGIEGRAREAQVPALLELLGITYTGSDPTALSLSLDKGLAKRVVAEAGIATPTGLLMSTGKERLPKGFTFPAITKPVHEGSSKGIIDAGVVETEAELRELAQEIAGRYRQSVLVETYLPGREFTVGLLGERRPRVLPPMEIVFDASEKNPVYSFDHKFQGKPIQYSVPADIEPALKKELERASRVVFSALGCRDMARVDFRLDAAGRLHFIECNPLPGLTPGFSDYCVIAEAAGIEYRALIGEILAPAMRRFRQRRRARLLEGRP